MRAFLAQHQAPGGQGGGPPRPGAPPPGAPPSQAARRGWVAAVKEVSGQEEAPARRGPEVAPVRGGPEWKAPSGWSAGGTPPSDPKHIY